MTRLLSQKCTFGAACPSVHDPEDGSGELIIVGITAGMVCDEECGIPVGPDETMVRIPRAILLEAALKLNP